MKKKLCIVNLLKCVFVGLSFFVIDFTLRFFTRWLGYYSIFELAPSLFSLCWIAIFVVVLSLLPRKVGRIMYAVWYGVWSIYTLIQYVYYLIFNKFFFLSDILYASEGGNYLDYVSDVINVQFWMMLGLFFVVGVVGCMMFPDFLQIGSKRRRNILRIGLVVCSCVGSAAIPQMLTENLESPFLSSKYEYSQFTNSGFDMEIAGSYHYVARDLWKSYLKSSVD